MSGRRSISNTFTVTTMDEPIAGPRGKTGRFYYYSQEWTNSSSPLYIVTDAQAPYFLYNNNYWVFNPEENYPNGISMSAMGTPSSNNSKWQLMTNDFKYIITQAIFGKYAHFGSAIINEDWLISTHGTIDGTSYGGSADNPDKYQGHPAYTYFDPNGFPYINRNQWTIGGSESTCEHDGFELTLTRGRSYTFNITGSIASGSWTMSVGLKNVATGNIISLTSFNSTTQTTKTVTVTISSGATGSSVWRLYQSRSGGSSNGYVTRFESNGSHCFIPNYAIDLRTGASYQNNAHIKGYIEATSGTFSGTLNAANGTFTGSVFSNDNNVVLTKEVNAFGFTNYTWAGFATTNNGIVSGDLATIGARLNDNGYDYGRIVLIKREAGASDEQIDENTIELSAFDGSIKALAYRIKNWKILASGDLTLEDSVENRKIQAVIYEGEVDGSLTLKTRPPRGTVMIVKRQKNSGHFFIYSEDGSQIGYLSEGTSTVCVYIGVWY